MPLNESRLLGNAPLSNAPFAPRFLITHLALPAGAALIISSLLMDGGGDFGSLIIFIACMAADGIAGITHRGHQISHGAKWDERG
jgi:hypothetical protein